MLQIVVGQERRNAHSLQLGLNPMDVKQQIPEFRLHAAGGKMGWCMDNAIARHLSWTLLVLLITAKTCGARLAFR